MKSKGMQYVEGAWREVAALKASNAALLAERDALRAALEDVVGDLSGDDGEDESYYCECDNTHARHSTECRPCHALHAARAALSSGAGEGA